MRLLYANSSVLQLLTEQIHEMIRGEGLSLGDVEVFLVESC